MRRAKAWLLLVTLAALSVGVSEVNLIARQVAFGSRGGLTLRFDPDGGIGRVSDGARVLPRSGARGGFSVRLVAGNRNLLPNGGFEDGTDGWRTVAGEGTATTDRDAHRGQGSVRVSLPARGTSAALETDVAVHGGTEYTLTVWIRTEGIEPQGAPVSVTPARVEVVQAGVTGRAASAFAFAYTGDSDWSRHDTGFRTAPGVTRVRVRIVIRGGSGTAWFDDLVLSRLFRPEPIDAHGGLGPGGDALRLTGDLGERGLSLEAGIRTTRPGGDAIRIDATLAATDERDHAAELSFTLPVGLRGWWWGDDVRRQRTIERGTYANLSDPTPQGGPDDFSGISQIQRTSVYPFGGVHDARTALGIGVPMNQPRAFRISANADGLTIAFDLGLSADAAMGDRADVSFVIYRTPGEWGFRALAQGYANLFPQAFTRRTDPAREGAWFFAPPLDSLPGDGYRDFGLGFNTVALGKAPTQSWSTWGTRYVGWSNARQIYAMAYTHQWAFFLPADRPESIGPADAESLLRAAANGPPGRLHDEATAALASTSLDANGRPRFEVYRGFLAFYQNLGGDRAWSDAVMTQQVERAQRLAREAGGHLNGIHLDSTSGARRWGAAVDFDRAHWADAQLPLSFDYASGRVAQLGVLGMYAQIGRVSKWARDRGLIVSANVNGGTDRALGWLGADRIDAFGIEQGLPDKAGSAGVDPLAMLKRTLALRRPVTTLDTAIADGTLDAAGIEARIRQDVFYGFFPGAWVRDENEDHQTVATWSTPEKRAIFARYSPVLRELAAAGWEPVTGARSSNPAVWIERFGRGPGRPLYLTLRNETDASQPYVLSLDRELLGDPVLDAPQELLSGAVVTATGASLSGSIAPHDTQVIRLG